MKIFMLGWEFPPFISGGLGTACYGLTKAMSKLGLEVTFVLPRSTGDSGMTTHVTMRSPADIKRAGVDISGYEEELKNIKIKTIDSALRPYGRPESYQQQIEDMIRIKRQSCNAFDLSEHCESQQESHYAGDMYTEIQRYAAAAVHLAMQDSFDVVHAHDWMTYPAGVAVAAVSGKPLVIHVHSTEFDRSGEHVNQTIYDIERSGMHAARRIIAVSYLTRSIIISRYGVTGDKVEVVHNGVERESVTKVVVRNGAEIKQGEKIVLFLGRITMQKGPEYFLGAAKRVLEIMDNVKFVMAGSG
ncbi:MAG: glycosyltransferase, partial [Planctomycetes bacterium]|nr:glycosyltransferase [Planctomycetota bacterium]